MQQPALAIDDERGGLRGSGRTVAREREPGEPTVVEPAELGARLQLPAWLEPHRAAIERRLPALAD